MTKSIKPSHISGTIKAPASKSMMQRAIAAALLADDPLTITNPTYSNDASAALDVIRRMGAVVEISSDEYNNEILIKGGMKPAASLVNCGESGLGIRMFTPILSLWHEPLTLTGEGSLLKRPVSMMEAPLRQLGVNVSCNNGYPPIRVSGPLQGGVAEVDGSVSSQFLTGLLMALPKARQDSLLRVKDLKSTPYIDMTIKLLTGFGVVVNHDNYQRFSIAGNQRYRGGKFWVEGDWSGAAFLLIAGAVGGKITVTGMDTDSAQADRKIVDALKAAGAFVEIGENQVTVEHRKLHAFDFDATHCPDLFPPLTALACNCEGVSRLTGVERLTHKESNRAEALLKEFTALGGDIRIQGNIMEIRGCTLWGGRMDSHNDHRIAMAGAVAAINAQEEVVIEDHHCVAKSYPDFFEDFRQIGGRVDE